MASRRPEVDEMQKGQMGVSREVRSGEKKGWATQRQLPLLKGMAVWRGREHGLSQGGATRRKGGGPGATWREEEGDAVRAEAVGVRPTAGPGHDSVGSSGAWAAFGQGRRGPRPRGPPATVQGSKPVQIESVNSSTFKFISNNFKLDSIQKGLSQAQKIQNKIRF
jgi:hypothetical protein